MRDLGLAAERAAVWEDFIDILYAPFTIWITVLVAIGLSVTGNIPRPRAAVAAALVWVAGGLPLIAQALRSM